VNSVSDLREPDPFFHLRLQARPESMAVLRDQLRGWLKEAGATGRELFEIQLAVTEAFANAVEHPHEPTSHLVDIAGSLTDQTITVSIRDYGTWHGERTRKEQGGFGFVLMEALMDTVRVESFPDGTTVTMHRRTGSR
jgi:anti-sigma regulatory factor (Ser/Thr protein kinase)